MFTCIHQFFQIPFPVHVAISLIYFVWGGIRTLFGCCCRRCCRCCRRLCRATIPVFLHPWPFGTSFFFVFFASSATGCLFIFFQMKCLLDDSMIQRSYGVYTVLLLLNKSHKRRRNLRCVHTNYHTTGCTHTHSV